MLNNCTSAGNFSSINFNRANFPQVNSLPMPTGGAPKQSISTQDQLCLQSQRQAPQPIVIAPQQQPDGWDALNKALLLATPFGGAIEVAKGGVPQLANDVAEVAQAAWNGLCNFFGGGQQAQAAQAAPQPAACSAPAPQPAAPQAAAAPFDYASLSHDCDNYGAAFDKADANHDGLLTGNELTTNGVVYEDPANVGQLNKQEFIQRARTNEGLARKQAMDLSRDPAAATKAINQAFKSTLGREATAEEISNWTDAFSHGWTATELQDSLKDSDEARVRDAYKEVMGHDFIGNSREFYMGELKARGSVQAVKDLMVKMRQTYIDAHVSY